MAQQILSYCIVEQVSSGKSTEIPNNNIVDFHLGNGQVISVSLSEHGLMVRKRLGDNITILPITANHIELR